MKRIWLFLAVTFGLTWGLGALFLALPQTMTGLFGPPSTANPLFLFAVWAPTLAAVGLAAAQGRAGLSDLLGRLVRWRVGWRWYALATVGLACLLLGARALTALLNHQPLAGLPGYAAWPGLIGGGLAAFILDPGPLGEELGWRGYLLPRLEQRWNGLASALICGVIWGIWHLPAFFVSGLPQNAFGILPFLIDSIALSVLFAWLVNSARGSVIIAILLHWGVNRFGAMTGPEGLVTTCALCAAALAAVLATRGRLRADRMPAPPQ